MNQLLVALAHLPVQEQKNELEATLKDWLFLGKQMQIDDILICGFALRENSA